MLKIVNARIVSKSFKKRVEPVDTLVLHYTAVGQDQALKTLREGPVSVHYVLTEDGTVHKILENNEVGYHAGVSFWRGKTAVNERSIGVEIINLDGNVHEYPAAQITALIELCQLILAENPGIKARNVVGHSDVSPKRKVDPGRLFPWKQLAEAGIGLWPFGSEPASIPIRVEIQKLLEACGYAAPHHYGVKSGGGFAYMPDPAVKPEGVARVVTVGTPALLRAFHLHYFPALTTGVPNKTSMGMLRKLADLNTAQP